MCSILQDAHLRLRAALRDAELSKEGCAWLCVRLLCEERDISADLLTFGTLSIGQPLVRPPFCFTAFLASSSMPPLSSSLEGPVLPGRMTDAFGCCMPARIRAVPVSAMSTASTTIPLFP